jgi:hypothetical protein
VMVDETYVSEGESIFTGDAAQIKLKIEDSEAASRSALLTIKAKLRALVDLPVTARTLVEIECTARLARELFILWQDPHAKMRDRNIHHQLQSPAVVMPNIQGGDFAFTPAAAITSPQDPQIAPAAVARSPTAENFAAQLVRELVSIRAGAPARSAADLVAAIAIAREKGLNGLAVKLESELAGGEEK